jgi:hypothetical protein
MVYGHFLSSSFAIHPLHVLVLKQLVFSFFLHIRHFFKVIEAEARSSLHHLYNKVAEKHASEGQPRAGNQEM